MSFFIHPAEARRQFVELVAGEITNSDLARASLLIALEEYPRLDVEGYLGRLDALATRAAARGSVGDPPVFRLGHLHAEMFDADGYRGDADNYYDVRNVYLNEVIDRRAGLPIMLSIVFLHVATRLGLTPLGVGLPGHYIVKVQFELNEVYVDPFVARAPARLDCPGDAHARPRQPPEHVRAQWGREEVGFSTGQDGSVEEE